ncbi:glutathionylspermidine synthase [Sulfurimonas aquatica]|uniref:Glutathionylspermidine synthase n=2 Tax=Sulfurimonas aquatica TaxID=2672570 RepID=A0A975B2V8_9BACT|nr:glutathionylspermidine synthase family protein [Sulfurimonas aquatica]QSZ43128.1 glutathionylspermidine synthase [Sulfurimonas aquatica]
MGLSWHTDSDGEYVVGDKLLAITEQEALAYHDAANELYEMYEKAAEYVIENELFELLDIPKSLIQSIKNSFKNERDNHLYSRFDLSGGIDGTPIKLIEFNADTPTMLLESSLIQLLMLKSNSLEDKKQFNNIYESIGKKIKSISKSKSAEYSRFLFSCISGIEEELNTTKLLQKIAQDEGLLTEFSYLEDTYLDDKHDFMFKLYPWEEMESFEESQNISMLNPSYTLLYQSKGMLAILYKLFPDSPYLLETSFKPIKKKYVKKRMFGREGANIDIVDERGEVLTSTEGIYDEYKAIYQEYTPFVKDEENSYYQAGVFYSDGACGLGFRKGAEILDNMSKFVGHVIL